MEIRLLLTMLSVLLTAGVLRGQTFTEREVFIDGADGAVLAGTLTMPSGTADKVPAVVLITGSGAQNRDEELAGHRPFKVIAEYLSSHGYAVLRCDDRGVGGSTGEVKHATTLDFAQDVRHQVDFLQGPEAEGVDAGRVFLFGHSEGGTVAAIAAAGSSGSRHPIAGVAMLGGAAVNGKEVLLQQNGAYFRLAGLADSLVERRLACMQELFAVADTLALHPGDDTVKRLNAAFRPIFRKHSEGLSREQKQQIGLGSMGCYGWAVSMAMPWMQTFVRLEPAEYVARLRCPLLAMGGDKDCQVLPINLELMGQVCTANGVSCTVQVVEGANHLGQTCETGFVDEYARLGQAPNDEILRCLLQWLDSVVRK